MVIDDTIANIKVLVSMLTVNGHKIRTFTSGFLALKSANIKKPDLILLDIDMPGMNGYEVCKLFKENAATKDIPIIFVSALSHTENIITGFNAGGVDYITKPFQWQEVVARVNTQLEILKAKRELELVLSKTFVGSVQIMADILATTKPDVFHFAIRMKQIIKLMSEKLDLKDRWLYETSGLLSLLGFITFTDEKIGAYVNGNKHAITTKEKKEAFEFSIKMLSRIPRLDPIVEIIRNRNESYTDERLKADLNTWSKTEIGANMLGLILEYLELSSSNSIQQQVFDKLISQQFYHKKFIEMLIKVEIRQVDSKEIEINSKELGVGMTISRDVYTLSEVKLLKQNTLITENLLTLIQGYQRHIEIKEPIYVWKNES